MIPVLAVGTVYRPGLRSKDIKPAALAFFVDDNGAQASGAGHGSGHRPSSSLPRTAQISSGSFGANSFSAQELFQFQQT